MFNISCLVRQLVGSNVENTLVYATTGCNNHKDIIILQTLYLYWRGYILLASIYLFRGIGFVSNYCIRYYRSNNSLVLFSILLLVLVSGINLSILTRYIQVFFEDICSTYDLQSPLLIHTQVKALAGKKSQLWLYSIVRKERM